ncbi:MAG: hypothetical protein ABIN18_21795 [Pseudomonadota bacterium]
MLEMVSYNFKIVSGVPQKSSITRVPDISKEQLDDIVQNVMRKAKKNPLSKQVLRGVYKVNEGGYEFCITF